MEGEGGKRMPGFPGSGPLCEVVEGGRMFKGLWWCEDGGILVQVVQV